VFGICSMLFVMSMFYRMSNAVIVSDLCRDLDLGPRELGLMGGAFFYAFALIQVPLGLLLDRAGAKRTMIFLNLLGVLGAVVFSLAKGWSGAFVGRALLGLGMAANLMGALKLFTHWFDLRRFATVSGLLISLGTLGALAATSPLALLAELLGWRGAFLVLAGLHGCLVLCLALVVHERPHTAHAPQRPDMESSFSRPGSIQSLKTLFQDRNYWSISWSMFLRYGAFASIQALWAGPFLTVCMGLSTIWAGHMLLFLSLGGILGAPVGGFVSDRLLRSRKRTLLLAMGGATVTLFLWGLWPLWAPLFVLAAILFISGFFSAFNQISYAHIRELMPSHMSGTAMAGINVFTMAGAGVFIHALGEVIAFTGGVYEDGCVVYRLAFLICSVAVAVSVILYTLTRDADIPAGRGESAGG